MKSPGRLLRATVTMITQVFTLEPAQSTDFNNTTKKHGAAETKRAHVKFIQANNS